MLLLRPTRGETGEGDGDQEVLNGPASHLR